MITELDIAGFSNHDVIFVNEYSGSFIFSSDEMRILSIVLDIIILDDVNFDEDDPETIFHVRLMTWLNRFKQRSAFKKDKSKKTKKTKIFQFFL